MNNITEFTFFAEGGKVPKITINGKKLGVINCTYAYFTADAKRPSRITVAVEGIVNGEQKARSFRFDFVNGDAWEVGVK